MARFSISCRGLVSENLHRMFTTWRSGRNSGTGWKNKLRMFEILQASGRHNQDLSRDSIMIPCNLSTKYSSLYLLSHPVGATNKGFPVCLREEFEAGPARIAAQTDSRCNDEVALFSCSTTGTHAIAPSISVLTSIPHASLSTCTLVRDCLDCVSAIMCSGCRHFSRPTERSSLNRYKVLAEPKTGPAFSLCCCSTSSARLGPQRPNGPRTTCLTKLERSSSSRVEIQELVSTIFL